MCTQHIWVLPWLFVFWNNSGGLLASFSIFHSALSHSFFAMPSRANVMPFWLASYNKPGEPPVYTVPQINMVRFSRIRNNLGGKTCFIDTRFAYPVPNSADCGIYYLGTDYGLVSDHSDHLFCSTIQNSYPIRGTFHAPTGPQMGGWKVGDGLHCSSDRYACKIPFLSASNFSRLFAHMIDTLEYEYLSGNWAPRHPTIRKRRTPFRALLSYRCKLGYIRSVSVELQWILEIIKNIHRRASFRLGVGNMHVITISFSSFLLLFSLICMPGQS